MRGLRWFGDGRCLAEDVVGGRTHSVARMLPGELARVELHEGGPRGRRRFVATDILERSMQRVVPDCPSWHQGCDGCNLLHLTEFEEQTYKSLLVHEVLDRIGRVRWPVNRMQWVGGDETTSDDDDWTAEQPRRPLGHRRRMRVRVSVEDGVVRTRFGGVLPGSVVDVPHCGAVTSPLQHALGVLSGASDEGLVAAIGAATADTDEPLFLEVCEGGPDRLHVMVEHEPAEPMVALAAALTRLLAGHGLVVDTRPATDAVWSATHSRRGAALMAWMNQVLMQLDPAPVTALDATCGSGAMTAVLAGVCQQVVAVDINYAAVRATEARAEAEGWSGRLQARGGRIETVLPRLVASGAQFDVVVFNPMRRTLGLPTMTAVSEVGAHTVLYFAPAPRAAAEDIGWLRQVGFELTEVCLVDLHPGTSRVMAAMVLTRRSGALAQ